MKVKINTIEIEIAGTKIKLTLEQARELKAILNETFPDAQVYPAPIIIERNRWYDWPQPYWKPDVICSTSGDSGTLSLCAK